jgi:hypothetical protein
MGNRDEILMKFNYPARSFSFELERNEIKTVKNGCGRALPLNYKVNRVKNAIKLFERLHKFRGRHWSGVMEFLVSFSPQKLLENMCAA